MLRKGSFIILLLVLVLALAACAKKSVTEIEPVAEPEPMVTEPVAEPPVVKVEKTAEPEPVVSEPVVQAVELKTIYFEYDSHRLTEDAREILAANVALLHKDAEKRIVIEGHCDERGSDSYNLALGERRAQATRTYLETLGVLPQRCTVVSYGEERPAVIGHNEKAWDKNRRVEFR